MNSWQQCERPGLLRLGRWYAPKKHFWSVSQTASYNADSELVAGALEVREVRQLVEQACPTGVPSTTIPRWADGLSPRQTSSPSSAMPRAFCGGHHPCLAQVGSNATMVSHSLGGSIQSPARARLGGEGREPAGTREGHPRTSRPLRPLPRLRRLQHCGVIISSLAGWLVSEFGCSLKPRKPLR